VENENFEAPPEPRDSVNRLDNQQRKVLKTWRKLLVDFTRREWFSIFIWSGLGAVFAGLVRLLLLDRSFQHFLASKYMPSGTFDDPRLYLPYLITFAVTIFVGIALQFPTFLWRGLQSWWAGVTSGLALLSFTSSFILLTQRQPSTQRRLIIGFAIIVVSFLFSFVLYLRARTHAEDTPVEDDLRVAPQARSIAGTQLSESDDPIRTWTEDALGRASLVDSMSIKLMISKSPVLALFGEFGSGKTSILNLLREHLADKAIIVSFSTWLPGSQDTLTAYLLSDIAGECQKQYVVPGLRKSAQRLAKALGHSVPLLRSYLESLPAATQKDDLDSMKVALARLPKRVIVLLDELDRMEKDELVTLLKIIRGVSALPNLSFVCAGDRRTIIEIVKEKFSDNSNTYFEKFFPASIQIPEADPAALRKAGTERLVAAFNRRNWFEGESQVEAFRNQIDSVWARRIAPFCRNLRAIGLLANDVGAAAAPLRREVHPVDLTLIELLRRFKPAIYEIVARNSAALTGGESIVRSGTFRLNKETESAEEKLLADLRQAASGDEEFQQVKGVLAELFPLFLKIADSQAWASRPKRQDSEEQRTKRISQPGIFPAYFRYQLPEAMFSSVELDALLRQMSDASKDRDRECIFVEALNSMEKGSLRRDDFLRKLADAASKSIPLPIGKALVHAAMRSADKYVYDTFPAFREAGHVLRIVIRVSERVHPVERADLLAESILEATDDTMALRVLQYLTGPHDDFNLDVSFAQLYPSFTKRMRRRYGPDADAVNFDFSTSDPWAFDLWGRTNIEGIAADPQDRTVQYDFWRRHIVNSRSRLARAFRGFFLPVAAYSADPAVAVENKIPVADLRVLYRELPDDGALTDIDRRSLATLRRFLDGEFKDGIGPFGLYDNESAATA
jgi:predicted KAP-like P-loop ATPase/F0F1-type ATP synthase membrane subunit c/vacuolar-type H+-ATPase subunit K